MEFVVPLLVDELNVVCEKPRATALAGHDRITSVAERTSGLLYVGLNLRHAPKYIRFVELLTGDRIGRLSLLSAHEVRVSFPWHHYDTQAESGVTLLEKDCYDVDIFD